MITSAENKNKEITMYYLHKYTGTASELLMATEIELDFEESYYNRKIIKHHENSRRTMRGADRSCFHRGIAKYTIGDHKGALDDLNRAIDMNPRNAEAYCLRGFIKSRSCVKGEKQAIEDFNRAIEIDPVYAEAYCNRGDAKVFHGDYKKAIEDLTRAVELDPEYGEAYKIRGFAKYIYGDKGGACLDWLRAANLKVNGVDELIENYFC